MTKSEFDQIIILMRKLWPKKSQYRLINSEQITSWWKTLSRYTLDDATQAIHQFRQESPYFPQEYDLHVILKRQLHRSRNHGNYEHPHDKNERVKQTIASLSEEEYIDHAVIITAADTGLGGGWSLLRAFLNKVRRGLDLSMGNGYLEQMIAFRVWTGVSSQDPHVLVSCSGTSNGNTRMLIAAQEDIQYVRELVKRAQAGEKVKAVIPKHDWFEKSDKCFDVTVAMPS